MKAENIFNLTSRHNQWLTLRQTTVAGNVANANTPGYRSLDVQPFEEVLSGMQVRLATTRPEHIPLSANQHTTSEQDTENSWAVVHSGNSVNLEQEMLKAGDVQRSFALNTTVTKSFHKMLLASTKG
ncbi:MAG: flagellar basal body rod protein FlgB [Hyphomicrobiaceae bacterium]